MIEDRKTRELIRKILIISSTILAIVALVVCIFGAYSLRTRLIQESENRGQFYTALLENTQPIQEHVVADRAVAAPAPVVHNVVKKRPKIAIMIINLGFNRRATEMSLSLPSNVGLGFVPYTTSLKPLMYHAIERGHEVFLYMPFESTDVNYPGKLPILSSQTQDVNKANVLRLLSGFVGYKGLYGTPSETFSHDVNNLQSVLDLLQNKKLLLVLGTHPNSIDQLPKSSSHDVVSSAMLIDNEPTASAIKNNLQQLIALAKIHGKVIGYAQGYPLTINLLDEWIPSLIEEDIELVPVSNISN